MDSQFFIQIFFSYALVLISFRSKTIRQCALKTETDQTNIIFQGKIKIKCREIQNCVKMPF